jgi:hypothetical protein
MITSNRFSFTAAQAHGMRRPLTRWVPLFIGLLAVVSAMPAHAEETATAPAASFEVPRGARIVGHDDEGPIIEFTKEEMEAREAVAAFQGLLDAKREKERGPSPYALVNDQDPEGTVPVGLEKQNPMAFAYYFMELSGKAEDAISAGKYEDALKYQRAMVKATPGDALGYRLLCATHLALGQRAEAEEACHAALAGKGVTLQDATVYVDVALGESGTLSPSVRERVEGVIAHLQTQPSLECTSAQLSCRLGARLESAPRLEECVATLVRLAPNDPITLTYSWALAMAKQDVEAARGIAERAEQLQLPPALVQQMNEYVAVNSGWRAPTWLFIGAGGLLVSVGAWLAMRAMKKRSGSPATA